MRAQDPFGNYVVQYVLELDIADASIAVMNNLFGHYAELAQQKFSSNVVEKCLKLGGSQLNEVRARPTRVERFRDFELYFCTSNPTCAFLQPRASSESFDV